MMLDDLQMLEAPDRSFTRDRDRYRKIFHLTIKDHSPSFWETDCLMVSVSAGKGTIIINGAEITVEEGDFGVLHSYHVFSFQSDPASPLSLDAVIYPYPELVLMTFATEATDAVSDSVFYRPDRTEQGRIREFIRLLEDEFSDPATSQLICNTLLSQLMYTTTRSSVLKPAVASPGSMLLYEIASASFSDFSIEQLARKCGLSAREINRILRKTCGTDFRGALNHCRLSNAYSMLLRENTSMLLLALESGFQNESSFYRSFRDCFGSTPFEYKNELKQLLGIEHTGTDENVLEIEAYILNHFREPIHVNSCSQALFLSKDAINAALQKKYGSGTSFSNYLTSARLRYAAGLLTMSSIPVIDTALDSGFNSIHTFIRCFKQAYGTTPSEYRKQYKEAEHDS